MKPSVATSRKPVLVLSRIYSPHSMIRYKKPRYMIGSGWWCSGEDSHLPHHQGDARIRDANFHHIWYRLVDNFTDPSRILIIDSASPAPPPICPDDKRIHIHRLASNPGHATFCQGRFCGWTASVLLGLQDCLHSDNDYFVYIEQDVLLYGDGIIELAISTMNCPYMFGDAAGLPQPLQQSLFIIHQDGIASFISHLLAIPDTDSELSPERKFHYSCQSPFMAQKFSRWLWRHRRRYNFLPFGYGRKRPLDLTRPHFYFQHGAAEEFIAFTEHLKLSKNIDLSW